LPLQSLLLFLFSHRLQKNSQSSKKAYCSQNISLPTDSCHLLLRKRPVKQEAALNIISAEPAKTVQEPEPDHIF
jgi:hypothetical protein